MLPLPEPDCPLAHTTSIATAMWRGYSQEAPIAQCQLGGMWVPRQRDEWLAASAVISARHCC